MQQELHACKEILIILPGELVGNKETVGNVKLLNWTGT